LAPPAGELQLPWRQIGRGEPLQALDPGIHEDHGARHVARLEGLVRRVVRSQFSPDVAPERKRRGPFLLRAPFAIAVVREAWGEHGGQRADFAHPSAGRGKDLLADLEVSPAVFEGRFDPKTRGPAVPTLQGRLDRHDLAESLAAVRDARFRVVQVREHGARLIHDAGLERAHQQVRGLSVRECDAGDGAPPLQVVLHRVIGSAQGQRARGVVALDPVRLGSGAGRRGSRWLGSGRRCAQQHKGTQVERVPYREVLLGAWGPRAGRTRGVRLHGCVGPRGRGFSGFGRNPNLKQNRGEVKRGRDFPTPCRRKTWRKR